MTLHRTLSQDLPPAEELRKGNAAFQRTVKDADGYYYFVQEIAARYGDRAYDLAEEVFREMGMNFDPVALRTPGKVRMIGYACDGANIYDIDVRPYQPEMAASLARLYNTEIHKLSRADLTDAAFFQQQVDSTGLFVAFNPNGQALGFVHCAAKEGLGSLEALIFLPGRIHAAVGEKLVEQARAYFEEKGVTRVETLRGRSAYPFYKLEGDLHAAFRERLPHISTALERILLLWEETRFFNSSKSTPSGGAPRST